MRAEHAAHVIPLTGMRIDAYIAVADGAAASGRVVALSVLLIASFSVLGDERAVEHAHSTGEVVSARLWGRELDHSLPAGWEEPADTEVGEDDLLRAAACIAAVEDEAHRPAGLHAHDGGAVAAVHRDGLFLSFSSRRHGADGRCRRASGDEEVPVDPADGGESRHDPQPGGSVQPHRPVLRAAPHARKRATVYPRWVYKLIPPTRMSIARRTCAQDSG